MSTGDLSQINQEEEDLQNELAVSNQLLRLISMELEDIKEITSPGGGFESAIKQNAEVMKALANLQRIDISKLPLVQRNLPGLDQNL